MQQHPEQAPDLESTARAHAAADRRDEALQAWTVLATRRPVGPTRAAALAEAARLLEALGRDAEAVATWRRALANEPTRPEVLDALARLAERDQDWMRLAHVHRLRFGRESDPGQRAALALAAGRLERDALQCPGAARSWFRDGLESQPGNLELLEALVDLERTRGDEATLLVSLERLIELRGSAARVAELREAAALRSARGEQARALAHLERACESAPEDASILRALAEVLAALDRQPQLADVLERRAGLPGIDATTRAAVLVELGALLEERLFEPEAALDAYTRAVDADPAAAGAADGVVRLRAKLEAAEVGDLPTTPRPETPRAFERGLRELEREARTSNDRARLGLLVREIEQIHRKRGTPDEALPWVQRWASAAPENPEALRALARVHDRPGHEAELCATLEALDPLLEPGEQAANRRRLGAIAATRGHVDEALRAYERALAIEPRDLEALEAMAALLVDHGSAARRIEVLLRIVELREPRTRASVLAEIADLQEQAGDLAGAIASAARLESEDGAPPDAEARLDRLLERAQRFEELAVRLRRRGERHDPGSAEAVALALRRAALLHDPLGRPEQAAEVYREALRHAPESPEARAGLERALRASIDATGLAAFLEEQAREAPNARDREQAALERAILLDEALEQADAARDAYRRLAEHAEDAEIRAAATRRFERLLERTEDWETLKQHLERELAQGTPEERARRHERLARLCGDRLGDEEAEIRHLEQIVALDASRADIWRVLSERYDNEDRVDAAIDAMQHELASGPEPSRALTLHARLAELMLQARRDETRAAWHYERVFELNPGHAAAARFLIERYESDRRPDDVIRVLESRLAALDIGHDDVRAAETRAHRTALRVHIAEVRARQLDDLEGAISALEVALGEVGPIPQVAEPLAACYQLADYDVDLIELCRNAATRSDDPGETANWLVRLGDAFLSRNRLRDAADAYRRALSERPDDRNVQASLRDLYRRLGLAEPLASLLEAELTHLAGPDETPVRVELAGLLAGPLERPLDALLHARRVLQIAPGHAEAFGLALAQCERTGEHEVALGLIEGRLEVVRTLHERVRLLTRRAQLLAGPLERPDEAIDAAREALALASDGSLQRLLLELLERQGRDAERLEVFSDLAREGPPEERAGWLERAAALAAECIGPDAALPWLERLRCVRRDDVEVVLRIAQIHRSAGRSEALLRALDVALPLAHDAAQRRELLLERAALLEIECAVPGRAVAVLERAREIAPADPEVLGRLERLQRKLGHHAARADTLEALLRTTPREAFALRIDLAELYAGPLSDPQAAVVHWREALPLAPGLAARIGVLRSLAAAYRRAGWVERWAEMAEAELAALDASPVFDDRRRELRRDLALAYDAELPRPERALRHLRALLDAGEDDLLGGEALDRLEGALLRRLREAGASVELEARLSRHLARRPHEAAAWLELARLRDEALQMPGAAIDAYQHALEIDPHDLEALRGLRAAAERLGRWAEVAETIERELAHPAVRDPALRGALLRRCGDVTWHRLQSTTRASRCYAAALECNGQDLAALRALQRLLESMEDWRGALDLYESEIEVLGERDPVRQHAVWLRVAAIARDRKGDVERARRALRHAARIAPLGPEELAALSDLHARAGDDESFAADFAAWCEAPETRPDAQDQLRLAEALTRLGRPAEALAAVERALALDPERSAAWDAAARLREAQGDGFGAATALRRAAGLLADEPARDRLLHAASLVEARDPARALTLARAASERVPDCANAQALRARLAQALGHHDEAETAAGHVLDLAASTSPERLREVALTGGDAARARGRLEAAAGFYGRALALDPRDPRASSAYGETLAALGDPAGARRALAARLSQGDRYPERPAHHALLARCHEAEGAFEEAVAAAEAALEDDPRLDEAAATLVRAHEALGHLDESIAAMERWARTAPSNLERAARLMRAADWELRSGEREQEAERHARDAVAADPTLAPAWVLLASLQAADDRLEEAIESADRAAAHTASDRDLRTLALIQASAWEKLRRPALAAEAFGFAVEADPRCVEAALGRARLLRGAGEWRQAATGLQAFLARHPDPDASALADVHEQLARLLAGPLEDVDTAVVHYRRAITLAPERLGARSALAELLSHRPGDHAEALEHLRSVLEADPADVPALRVALRIARAKPAGVGPGPGLALLRGLGAASAYELEESETEPRSPAPRLEDPRFETLRGVAEDAADAIAQALDASGPSDRGIDGDEPLGRFRAALLRIEGRLTAPALLTLPTREVAEVMTLVVRLTAAPESVHGDGRRVNALAGALRRRDRRRLRRRIGESDIEALCGVDFEHWRTEVRALAAVLALEETGSSLRTALTALVEDAQSESDLPQRPQADLALRAGAAPVARALLRRLVSSWLERI